MRTSASRFYSWRARRPDPEPLDRRWWAGLDREQRAAEVVRRYRDGQSIHSLSVQLEMARNTISAILGEAGYAHR